MAVKQYDPIKASELVSTCYTTWGTSVSYTGQSAIVFHNNDFSEVYLPSSGIKIIFHVIGSSTTTKSSTGNSVTQNGYTFSRNGNTVTVSCSGNHCLTAIVLG